MSRAILIAVFVGLFGFSLSAQDKAKARIEVNFAEFKSDGCSMFPDGDYVDCCYEHDKAYFGGGNWTARWRADKALYQCVVAKKGDEHKFIAPVMWLGVRVGGLPFLPTSFRWGFGRRKVKVTSVTPLITKNSEKSDKKASLPQNNQ